MCPSTFQSEVLDHLCIHLHKYLKLSGNPWFNNHTKKYKRDWIILTTNRKIIYLGKDCEVLSHTYLLTTPQSSPKRQGTSQSPENMTLDPSSIRVTEIWTRTKLIIVPGWLFWKWRRVQQQCWEGHVYGWKGPQKNREYAKLWAKMLSELEELKATNPWWKGFHGSQKSPQQGKGLVLMTHRTPRASPQLHLTSPGDWPQKQTVTAKEPLALSLLSPSSRHEGVVTHSCWWGGEEGKSGKIR